MNRGYYPIRVSDEEYRRDAGGRGRWSTSASRRSCSTGTERWIAMAEDKLAGHGDPRDRLPGERRHVRDRRPPDRARHVVEIGRRGPPDRARRASRWSRWAGRTRRRGTRSASCRGAELAVRIDEIARAGRPIPRRRSSTSTRRRTASKLDNAPALERRPERTSRAGRRCGPSARRRSRRRSSGIQPLLSLHGHIHESKGATRIGKTLALNPGSSYEEGVLQAALVTIDAKKRKVKNYQLVNG